MDILWTHNTNQPGSIYKTLGLYHNDVVHYLSVNHQQKILSYEIIKHPAHLANDIDWVSHEALFQLVPDDLAEFGAPGMLRPIKHPKETNPASSTQTNQNITLWFESEGTKQNRQALRHKTPNLHIAQGIFALANKHANSNEYVTVAWFHENYIVIFSYQLGRLFVANAFVSSNLQEHLYYTLLPFHDLKPSAQQVSVFVYFDAAQIQTVEKLFSKFIPQVKMNPEPLPIITEIVVPYTHIVQALIQLSECALPVAH